MRAVAAAVAIALMTAILALHATPSGAQIPSISEKTKDKKDGEAAMRAAAKKAEDKAYKSAVETVPEQQKLDPWRNLR
jgi:hypothetical protein